MGLLPVDRIHKVVEAVGASAASTGTDIVTYTVPAGRTAVLHSYFAVATGAATVTVQIIRANGNDTFALGTSTGGTVKLQEMCWHVLVGGDIARVRVTTGSGATTSDAFLGIEECGL